MVPFVLLVLLSICVGCCALARIAKHILLKASLWIVAGLSGFILILVSLLAAFFWQQEPPSLKQLAQKFPERRATLEEILAMSNQDAQFARIDPTFSFRFNTAKDGTERIASAKIDAPLPEKRWNEYKALFTKAHLDQGLLKDTDGNIFFLAGSIGLLNRGHSTGYLYCRDQGSTSSSNSGFEPCALAHRDSGVQIYGNEPRREAYRFEKITDHWFVFDQGPS